MSVAGLLGAWLLALAPAAAGPNPDPCQAQACGTIAARVRAGGQREAMADTAVIAVPASSKKLRAVEDPASDRPAWIRRATTDAAGDVTLTTPPGLVRLVIVAPGFDRYEAVVEVTANQTTPTFKLFPRPQGHNPYRTVVRTPTDPARVPDVAARRLTREEIATLPGSQGDPLRALQNLPGVARTPGGLGLLVLRGASPNQSGVYVGEHPVPRAFHALSLASVVPADIIERLDYVPGNFDSRYGNATGGVVVIEPRRGRRDGVHGFGEIDLAAASALIEGRLGKRGGSFVVAAQRGWVDAVLKAAERVIGQNDLLLPRYFDYQALVDHPLRGGGSISARVIGSGDRIVLDGVDPYDGQQKRVFDFRSDWHRADVVVRKRFERWRFMVSPAFRYEVGKRTIAEARVLQLRRDYVTSLRAEAVRRLSDRFEVVFGADSLVDAYTVRGESPSAPNDPTSPLETTSTKGLETSLGVYATGRLQLGPLLVTPGVRASGFLVGGASEFSVDPRINARLQLGERWSLKLAVGSYSQLRVVRYAGEARVVPSGVRLGSGYLIIPSFFSNFEPIVTFEPLADTLRVIRALQASAGVAHEFLGGFTAELTGFVRVQNNGVPPAVLDQPLRGSQSRVYGFELLLRQPLTRRLYGWLAYTLMHSELRNHGLGLPDAEYTGDFDQRHNLAVILSYKLPKNWQIGGRFRVVSGLPFTPVVGGVQYADGSFLPVFGTFNSDRFPPFHQLDVRVDKRWVLKRTSVTGFLDVQNVYNRQNIEVYLYNYDFRQITGAVGLPIFPSIGVRVDF
ncbi:MAG: TonB-dependent receptor [Myxococcales bacterium]|nr:TonB-dependent receptor [Myxococcales bacterium]